MGKPREPSSSVFVPHAVKRCMKSTYLELEPELHERIKKAAHAHELSMRNFMIQAIEFALNHVDVSD